MLKEFHLEFSGLENWLEESCRRLADVSDYTPVDDVPTIEIKVKKLQSLCDEIHETKVRVANLMASANNLLQNSEPKFESTMDDKLETFSAKWHELIHESELQYDKYKDVLKKNDEVRFNLFFTH